MPAIFPEIAMLPGKSSNPFPYFNLMPDIQQLIQSGSAHVWLYVPVAILLGALHGLEPGHSKTMMAAFIIAIRGTVLQAVLLGGSAAISHSLLIWVLAALALSFGSNWNAEHTEPYFHLASAVMILGLAIWMFLRTRRELEEAHQHLQQHQHSYQQKEDGHSHTHEHKAMDALPVQPKVDLDAVRAAFSQMTTTSPALSESESVEDWQSGAHSHSHSHSHSHTPLPSGKSLLAGEAVTSSGLIVPPGLGANAGTSLSLEARPSVLSSAAKRRGMNGGALLDTGHGWLEVCIHKTNGASRFRIFPCKASGQLVPLPKSTHLSVETARLDGRTQQFRFEPNGSCWEATSELPQPHEFLAVITLGHADHAHTYRLQFSKDASGSSDAPSVTEVREDDGVEYQDAHERAHAEDIARRFANRTVTTPQIVLFGITGGLMPCPAAFTVLLVCLQVKRVTLGFTLVAAFSLGLALTMVAVGVIAAWSLQKAHKKFTGLGEWMRRAPYISCALLVLLALLMAWQGWQGLYAPHHAHG